MLFGDLLRLELRPEGAGCLMVFTHAFADRATAARTAAGWDRCFARMDALLGGGRLGEADALEHPGRSCTSGTRPPSASIPSSAAAPSPTIR